MNQATQVSVYRVVHLPEPTRAMHLPEPARTTHMTAPPRAAALVVTQRNPALVRALFGQLCEAVGHAGAARGVVHCPADFGISYYGMFYDGRRTLAWFIYSVSGCQTVSLMSGGQTRFAVLSGAASAAEPKLQAALAAVLGVPASMLAQPVPVPSVNPGGLKP
ncbi:MAG: hypothetical protein JO037_04245 [Actinobacteria bacterium]|nr:hypothetical protein [Actinomycetota bacterium]